jgi:FkbM family methyltransferase
VGDGTPSPRSAWRRSLRKLQHRVTRPVRRTALPVMRGPGRGLRVRAGESIIRVTSRGEPKVESSYLGLLRPGDVVYDIGANIGWYSLLAARVVGPAGSVLAFEPSLENALVARQNAAVNRLANITVIAAALTDEDGWMPFLEKGSLEGRLEKDDGPAQAERRARQTVQVAGRTLVPATTLDSWIAHTGQPAPTLIKIDVEGAEVGALRGMLGTLRDARPTLIIELHGTRDEVADELDAAGYEHAAIERDVPTREAPWWAHVLATPKRVA